MSSELTPRTVTFSENSLAFMAQALARVGDEVKREVGALIPAAADEALLTLYRRYPRNPFHRDPRVPHMVDDMYIRTMWGSDPLIPKRKVVGPRLAYIWQNGTVKRSYYNRNAVEHRTGAATPQDTDFFEKTAVQVRWRLFQNAQAILDRAREVG